MVFAGSDGVYELPSFSTTDTSVALIRVGDAIALDVYDGLSCPHVSSERRVRVAGTDGSANNTTFVDSYLDTDVEAHEPHRSTFTRLCRARHVVLFWALYHQSHNSTAFMEMPSIHQQRTVRMRSMATT